MHQPLDADLLPLVPLLNGISAAILVLGTCAYPRLVFQLRIIDPSNGDLYGFTGNLNSHEHPIPVASRRLLFEKTSWAHQKGLRLLPGSLYFTVIFSSSSVSPPKAGCLPMNLGRILFTRASFPQSFPIIALWCIQPLSVCGPCIHSRILLAVSQRAPAVSLSLSPPVIIFRFRQTRVQVLLCTDSLLILVLFVHMGEANCLPMLVC